MRLTKAFALALISSLTILTAARADDKGISPSSIKIGMFAPLTGPVAFAAKVAFGAAAVYRDINDRGGINGRKIELIMEDDACDPNKGIAAVKKLMAQDQVFMIHGGWCSNVVLAAKPELLRDQTQPYVVLGAAAAAISTPIEKNIFHPVATTDTVAKGMVEFVLSGAAVKRVAIISHWDEWGKSQLEPALAALKAHGIEPVETVYFERGGTDATSQSLKLRNSKPDAVLAILYPAELAIYLRDAYKYGINAPTIGTQGVSIEDTAKRIGIAAAVRNLYVFYPLSDTIGSDRLKPWVDMIKKYYPNEPIDTVSFIGLGGALANIEVLKRLGKDVTREGFLREMDKLKNFDTGVQASPLTFTFDNHAGISAGKWIYLDNGVPTIVSKLPDAKG